MNCMSGPPPNNAPNSANGAVTAFSRILTKIFQMIGPKLEFRIVERAGHRKIQIDDAISILEQCHPELDRQRHRVLTRRLLAEFQLIDDDVVLRIELAAFDLVVQFGRELALGDVVSGEFSGVRVEDAKLDIAKTQFQIGVHRRAQNVDFSVERYRRELVYLAVQYRFLRANSAFDDRPSTVPSSFWMPAEKFGAIDKSAKFARAACNTIFLIDIGMDAPVRRRRGRGDLGTA